MEVKISFSDFFNVAPKVLEAYGAFDVSLINDLPLFIDPFLLFDSKDDEYQSLHEDIIRYVIFLRDVSVKGDISSGSFDNWFKFKEVKQNWLGFSKNGNEGNGLGEKFAKNLHKNLRLAFLNFGDETITKSSHLEKLCLLSDGVGRDHLSDFTVNLIKQYLLEYTQKFALAHIKPAFRKTFAVERVYFDYGNNRWCGKQYELPAYQGDFVLLTPKNMLTKDEAWINRPDLLDSFSEIYNAVPDDQLRAQIEAYLMKRLSEKPKAKERRDAAAATIEKFPEVLDYYIRKKEKSADQAHIVSGLKVRDTKEQFIDHVKEFVGEYLDGTEFYERGNSFEESLARVHFLKKVIEKNDGYRLFYVKGNPIRREPDLHLMYRLTWYATSFDVNREVNNGRGPVDFKISKGSVDKTLIEFKLASNTKLKQNLISQVDVYEAANDTSSSIKVIVYYSNSECRRAEKILRELKLFGRKDVVMIDASRDNKISASNATDQVQKDLDI